MALSLPERIVYGKRFSLGKLVDTIKSKLLPLAIELLIAFGISKISQKNRKTCPTSTELNNVIRTRNRVVRQLNQIFQSILINTALAAAFAGLSTVLRGVRLGIDAISIPQAFGIPPGPAGGLAFALPYSFTAKLQHINDVLDLEAINQELLDIAEEEVEDGNPIIGNVNGFILSVETDNKNPVGTLKRRFAIAKDTRGITLLKGEPSFSSSDQILIDELVFYIQQNNLKAN